MAWINLFLPADGAAIILGALNAWATRTSPDDSRTLDHPPQAGGTPSRADAAVELALAGLATPGLPAAHELKPVINITLAATTLTGTDDQPGQANGHPVPAQVARHWAAHPDATWRYWAVDQHGQIQDTDPTGHEPATSSYTPTPRIARHVSFRDQSCVFPGCRRPATQSQLDHRTPWPTGPTAVQNLQVLCATHHKAKHHSRWTVQRTSDGTYHWTSPTRHHYQYRPPEHPVPTATPPPPPGRADEPPPPY